MILLRFATSFVVEVTQIIVSSLLRPLPLPCTEGACVCDAWFIAYLHICFWVAISKGPMHRQPKFEVLVDDSSRWQSTTRSTYVRHDTPPRTVARSGPALLPEEDVSRLPFQFALAAHQQQLHHQHASPRELTRDRPARSDDLERAWYDALGRSPQPQRAMTPPPSSARPHYNANPALRETHDASVARIGGRKRIVSRCTEDHIVFENTLFEDANDPVFYHQHRQETDGYDPHSQRGRSLSSGGNGDDGTDFAALVERYGFPGKMHKVARRKYCPGQAQELSMTLFAMSRPQAPGHRGRDGYEPDFSSPTYFIGAGQKRHVTPRPQSMSHTFQAAGEEEPFFRGGKKCTDQRAAGDFNVTSRVLRTELQEPPQPFRSRVKTGMYRSDSLAHSMQGSKAPDRDSRRSFFDIRR